MPAFPFFCLLAILLFPGCDSWWERQPQGRENTALARNLIMVSLDTLRADHLGGYGYGPSTSPNLDTWAGDSFLFSNATSLANETIRSHKALFQSSLASVAANNERAPTLAGILARNGYLNAAFTDGGPLSPRFGFARGFRTFDFRNEGIAESLPAALAWLDANRDSNQPFYLFLHTYDIHLPYDPPPPYDDLFYPDYQGSIKGSDTIPVMRKIRRIFRWADFTGEVKLSSEDKRKIRSLYDGSIALVDHHLGILFRYLLDNGMLDDTMVVVFSDHGEEFWDHGSVLHSHTLYQELIRVVLMIRIPGMENHARRIRQRVSFLDVVPTILACLGIEAPPTLSGESLLPLLRGEPWQERPAFAESMAFGSNLQSVTLNDHKLIRDNNIQGSASMLFNLADDPAEQHDLHAQLPALRQELSALLDDAMGEGTQVIPHPLEDLPGDVDPQIMDRLRALGYVQ